jgi:sugar-specific transcriptional regulator TrmB
VSEDCEKLIEILNEEMGLSPYESKAYIAILLNGQLSPQGVNQKSGIPRPRTYDVLNSLVGKGLLMEQPGRPTMYAAVDPQIGLERMMLDLERKMLRQLEEKKRTAEKLTAALSRLHDRSQGVTLEERNIWVTRRDNAFVAKYCEAIRNVESEFVVATPDPSPPEKDVLEAVRNVLEKNKTVRVVRQITPRWTQDQLDEYEKLILLGDQVRSLKYDGLRFAVFDRKDTVLVLPAGNGSLAAIWISLPSLATILHKHFEALWQDGKPALPVLRKLREAKD